MFDTEPHAEGAALLPETRLLRETTPGPEALRPETFLRATGAWPRGFWARGDHWFAWAGEAARLEEPAGRLAGDPLGGRRFDDLRRRADALVGGSCDGPVPPRFHGGLAFSADRTGSGAWKGFPAYRFSLPVLEAAGGPDGVELLVTAPAGDGAAPRRARDRLVRAIRETEREGNGLEREGDGPEREGGRSPATRAGELPPVTEVQEPLSEEAWSASVERILAAIEAGRARKVVLARTLEARLSDTPDPLRLLRRLREANPRGYVFFLEPVPGRAFFGAAPELLGALDGRAFHATAVAGTIRRGRTPEEDEALARRLLGSEKDRAEHRIGVEDMCERLARVAQGARVDREPRVVRLNRVQHLRTDLTATLADRRHLLSLVGALHPTAAVCGHPREAADRMLREEERFDRGWYAAPVGWFDARGDGELAPGLRSAVLQGSRLRLFAGAGIVRGSEPRREWEETRLKFGPVLQLLGARPGR